MAQFFSAIEGGQSTHNDHTQQHARTGQSKHDVILFSWIVNLLFNGRIVKVSNGRGCFAHCSPIHETIQHMIDRIHIQKLFKITKNHESPVPLTK